MDQPRKLHGCKQTDQANRETNRNEDESAGCKCTEKVIHERSRLVQEVGLYTYGESQRFKICEQLSIVYTRSKRLWTELLYVSPVCASALEKRMGFISEVSWRRSDVKWACESGVACPRHPCHLCCNIIVHGHQVALQRPGVCVLSVSRLGVTQGGIKSAAQEGMLQLCSLKYRLEMRIIVLVPRKNVTATSHSEHIHGKDRLDRGISI